MIIPALFHWSPVDRRPAINRRGLVTRSRPSIHSFRADHICLSTDPARAWELSAGVFGVRGAEWDCWQVRTDRDDEVEIREFWGDRIDEVRIRNDIPKSRLWLIGSRTVPVRGRRR